jgi:alkylation response protein AidB-like acyl-CoA dehydrogenase
MIMEPVTATMTPSQVLDDGLLTRCGERASVYDEDNRFFAEDFEELRGAGYLLLAVPKELGGLGLSLPEVCHQQRRLAYHAGPTAIAINMHLYWTGIAADLWRSGDASLQWLLEAAAAGAVFAAGHAESGNDLPLLFSTTLAERVDGGYRFTGHKSFGSLSPVWTHLGLHGMDTSDPEHPKIVHAFLPRETEGVTIQDTWDTMGMRATASQDTLLDGAFVADRHVARVLPAGLHGADLFVLAIFAWSQPTFANVYLGIAQRAFDMVVKAVSKKESLALTRSMAHHAGVQHNVAEMAIELESIAPHIEKVAEDWSRGVDHGAKWAAKLVTAKYHATEGSWRVVDLALDTLGGFGVFKRAGMERLFRDARFGRIHPANAFLTRELVAKTALGLDFDEQPRWG